MKGEHNARKQMEGAFAGGSGTVGEKKKKRGKPEMRI